MFYATTFANPDRFRCLCSKLIRKEIVRLKVPDCIRARVSTCKIKTTLFQRVIFFAKKSIKMLTMLIEFMGGNRFRNNE